MYTKPKYSFKDVIIWTRWELLGFLFVGAGAVALYHLLGLKWLQIPWTPVALIGTAVAFLIGFQNNAAYGRIWEARKIWGGIVNASRAFGMMLQDMITNEYTDEPLSDDELNQHRKILLERHIAWLTALRHSMRQPKPWEHQTEHSTNKEWEKTICTPEKHLTIEEELRPLLSENDLARVLSKSNRPTAILFLQSSHLRELKEKKLIWEFSFLEMESLIKELFELQGKSERIKNFPYPRQYATLGYDFVKVFILMLPFALLPQFDKLGQQLMDSFPLVAPHFIWATVPITALVAWVFHTMHRIGTTGENPFEGTVNDVPISSISRGIEIDLRQQFDCGEIPEPFPAMRAVQM
jgi:putative membrane protein